MELNVSRAEPKYQIGDEVYICGLTYSGIYRDLINFRDNVDDEINSSFSAVVVKCIIIGINKELMKSKDSTLFEEFTYLIVNASDLKYEFDSRTNHINGRKVPISFTNGTSLEVMNVSESSLLVDKNEVNDYVTKLGNKLNNMIKDMML